MKVRLVATLVAMFLANSTLSSCKKESDSDESLKTRKPMRPHLNFNLTTKADHLLFSNQPYKISGVDSIANARAIHLQEPV